MNAGVSHALEQALAYYRAPALLAKAALRPLPDDVIELLRLAAGDDAQAAQSADASGESPQRVVEAAVFFVQQVMFSAEADDYRVLGVNPGAPAVRLREHFRWLIRWLHPDRNPDDWDSVYSDRVTRAWQSLRRSGALAGEGDAVPDAGLPAPSGSERADAAQKLTVLAAARLARISREAPAAPPMVSARTARHLPAFVMGGLGLVAVSLVALLWYAQLKKAEREIRTADAPAPAVDAAPAEPPAVPAAPVAWVVDSPVPVPEPELAVQETVQTTVLETGAPTPLPATLAPEPPARLATDQLAPPLPRSTAPPPARQPAAIAVEYVAPATPAPAPAPAPVAPVAPAATAATVAKPD
ncbi:MAG: hypothetical protein DCF27_10110, partial [Lysobacteraceae bacterium]